MLRATRAALPRRVRLDEGGQTYQVRPPSVRQAFELMYVLAESDGGEADTELLLGIMKDVFPEELVRECMSYPLPLLPAFVRRLLFDGIPGLTGGKRKKVETAAPAAWDDLFFQYCDHFRVEPWNTADYLPFGYFAVAMGDHVTTLAARRNLRDSQIAGYPNMTKSGRNKWVGEQQRQIRRSQPQTDDTPLTEEELNAERDKLAAALSQYN
jgi:hypothetical protein